MAAGIYAQVDLVAATNTTVFTTAAAIATYNIRIVNRNTVPITIRLGVCASGTSYAGSDFTLEYDCTIRPGIPLEETGIIIQTGKLIIARSDTSNVSILVWGAE